MATMSGVVVPGDSTVKHVEVDVPESDRIVTQPTRPIASATKAPPAKSGIVFD